MSDRSLKQWLLHLGLGRYATVFDENAIDWDVVSDLTDSDLQGLGMPLGHRKKLLKAIASLGGEVQPDSQRGTHLGTLGTADEKRRKSDADALAESRSERRHLTVMFCDLVGSTAMARQLDPEDMLEVLQSYQRTCGRVVGDLGGYIAQYLGDGILAYFGYPRATENDAERAVRSALGIIAALDPLNSRLQRTKKISLAARIGIATGVVVVSGGSVDDGLTAERTAIGETPNLAARLQAFARPNTVIVAESTRNLLAGRFIFEDLGGHKLAGFNERQSIWRVLGVADGSGRLPIPSEGGLSPFIGREEEMNVLLNRWRLATESDGQVVLVAGEPGIGKSRLTLSFEARIHGESPDATRFFCSSFHMNTALYPVIDHISRASGFEAGDSEATRLDKLIAWVGEETTATEQSVPLFAALLSISTAGRYPALVISPQKQKSLTFDAILDRFVGISPQHPRMIIVDDLQWIDPTTQELLDMMVERLLHRRLMIVCTFRPEYHPPWVGRTNVTLVNLHPLSRRRCEEFIGAIAGSRGLSRVVFEEIIERTEGIPLFVEELTKSALGGALVGDSSSSTISEGTGHGRMIPASIRDSLMARLDQLALPRDLAQVGSVIGRQFTYDLLAATTGLPDSLIRDALMQLVGSELVYQSGTPLNATYTFKHALIQDAAYDSLLLSRRRQLHHRVASVMESHFPDLVRSEPATVAHHYAEGGNAVRSIVFWKMAADGASRQSAYVEAANHLKKGLSVLSTLTEGDERKAHEVELQLPLGATLMALRGAGSQEVERAYARAIELCDDLPESSLHFAALWGWWRLSMNFLTGRERADALLQLASRLGDPSLILQAHHCIWATTFNLGDQEPCLRHIDLGLALYDENEHPMHASIYGGHDARVCGHGEAALSLWLLGCPDQALARIEAATVWAHKIQHAGSIGHALDITLTLHRYRRDARAVLLNARDMMRFAEHRGFPDYLSKARLYGGWAIAMLGDVHEGLRDIIEGLSQQQAIGTREDFPVYFDMLAETLQIIGDHSKALTKVEEGLKVADEQGIHYWTAELNRRKGVILSELNRPADEIEVSFDTALEIARRQAAKTLELRATISLARLKRTLGELEVARELLAPLVASFTEGLNTPDLEEANRLLLAIS